MTVLSSRRPPTFPHGPKGVGDAHLSSRTRFTPAKQAIATGERSLRKELGEVQCVKLSFTRRICPIVSRRDFSTDCSSSHRDSDFSRQTVSK